MSIRRPMGGIVENASGSTVHLLPPSTFQSDRGWLGTNESFQPKRIEVRTWDWRTKSYVTTSTRRAASDYTWTHAANRTVCGPLNHTAETIPTTTRTSAPTRSVDTLTAHQHETLRHRKPKGH